MAREEITVIIDAEGNPSVSVACVKGKRCTDITKELERELGAVSSDTKTKEYYQDAVQRVKN